MATFIYKVSDKPLFLFKPSAISLIAFCVSEKLSNEVLPCLKRIVLDIEVEPPTSMPNVGSLRGSLFLYSGTSLIATLLTISGDSGTSGILMVRISLLSVVVGFEEAELLPLFVPA